MNTIEMQNVNAPDTKEIFFGLLAAAVPISMLIAAVLEVANLFVFVLIVTVLVVLIVGGLFAARLRERVTVFRVLAAGFLTGALVPLGVSPFIVDVGMAPFVVLLAGSFGLAGMLGAALATGLAFWLSSGSRAAQATVGAILAAGLASIWIGPVLVKDRSCHNTLRDGRDSISPVAQHDIVIPLSDWPDVEAELDAYAASEGWESRSNVRSDPVYPQFYVSLCREVGTALEVSANPWQEDTITLAVYQPQGGDSWRAPFNAMRKQLEERSSQRQIEPIKIEKSGAPLSNSANTSSY